MLHRSGGTCARSRLGFPPSPRGAERRKALVRIAAPVGPPYGKASPVSGRDCRPMTRTGAPLGASPRRFLCPRDHLLETEGAFRRSPDPARLSPCVHPLHQPLRTRPHVVGAGGDPRPPGGPVDEVEPAGAAPRSANRTPPEGALSEQGWVEYKSAALRVVQVGARINLLVEHSSVSRAAVPRIGHPPRKSGRSTT
jgi:hypothetical protein